ncbi:MAG: EAL domain-containing protein, partial [Selenomonadaceae bacterium]
ELTETVVLDFNDKKQRSHVQKVFDEMHKRGFRTALDDFGSGYSSMLLLDFLPWNMLKLDRSFLNDLKKTEKSHVLLHHIIKMVHELDINVICEGIETKEQAELLQGLGCRLAQGFFYARPMTEEKFAERLGKEL